MKRNRFTTQLLKWVGNKQRFADEIISHFPEKINVYHEPFLGSGAVLGTYEPKNAVASDVFKPLVDIWINLKKDPKIVSDWYKERHDLLEKLGKKETYSKIRDSYNKNPNSADFLFLTRSCYGGVIRFRQTDGHMSTPCGPHQPISPDSFARRAEIWHKRIKNTEFTCDDYKNIFKRAKKGDLIYCDPPYVDSQKILYGAQSFKFKELIDCIHSAKKRGVYVALSIDGTKKSGANNIVLNIPKNLFVEEIYVNVGGSMLKRLQSEGKTMENEVVSDRLLLTYTSPIKQQTLFE